MKIQIFVLGLLVDYTDHIPCFPPAISTVHVKQSRSNMVLYKPVFYFICDNFLFHSTAMDAVLSMAEALIFGIVFTFVFRVKMSDIEAFTKGDATDRSLSFHLVSGMR